MASRNLREMLQERAIDVRSLDLLAENSEGVYRIIVPYEQVLSTWKALRSLVELTDYWPSILGAEPEMERILEQVKDYHREIKDIAGVRKTVNSVSRIVELAYKVDIADWVRKEIELISEDMKIVGEQFDFRHSEWPEDSVISLEDDTDPYDKIELHWYNSEKPEPNVYIGLFPTRQSWQIPAFLRFGAFNGCPHPDEHVAFLKHWDDQYGIEVVVMGADEIQVHVSSLPPSREQALILAQEQLLYNRELDWNDTSIEEMASGLMKSRWWFFWWD